MHHDNDAVRTLAAEHARFRSFLERRTGDRALAEDLLQDAYVRSLERGGEIRKGEATTAWLYRMLRNAVTDRFRRGGAERRALEGLTRELAEPNDAIETTLCRCVDALLEGLEPSYADILRRVDLEGEPLRSYAERIGISANNAGVRIHRARKALGRELALACGTCTTHGCLDCSCPPRACGN
jgi:RNA polymerase sigma factor (sigma-70 family)